ncbi:MAG: EAL domain-containing protein [bacterium]
MEHTINYETMNYMSNGVIIEDLNKSKLIFVNKKAKKLLKIKDNNNITKIKEFFSTEEVYNELKFHIKQDLSVYNKSEGTAYLRTLDNTVLEINFCCTWLDEKNNLLCYTFKKAVEVVGESDVSFKELAEYLPSGIIVMNISKGLSITYANNEHYRILGIDNKEIINNIRLEKTKYLLKDFIFEEDVHWVLSEIYLNLSKNDDVDIEFRMKTKDNIIKWVRLFGRAHISATGEKLFYSSLKDLSQRRNINDKLHMERVMFHKITELTDEVLFRLDLQTNIIYFLGAKSNMFGEDSVYENYPKSLLDLDKLHPDDISAHNELVKCFKTGIEKSIELRYKSNIEDVYEWYRVTYSFIKNQDDTCISVIGKMSNINTQKILEEHAKMDLLTGFYNKVTTEQEVDTLISYKNEKSFAMFIIDIDNFKSINDNLGHHFGDMVLTDIADDIRRCFRKNDILGRIGGDEFIVVMRDIGNTGVIIEKAKLLCKTLKKSFSGGTNYNYDISASVGISMYPSDGANFQELYQKSDIALYEIKDSGKNGYKQYFNNLEKKQIKYAPKIINNNFINYKTQNNFIVDNRESNILINNSIIITIFNLLYESKNLDSTIFFILEYIGKMFKIDKCYIFELDKDSPHNNFKDSYNWIEEHINNNISNVINKYDIYDLLNHTDKDGIFYTNDINNISNELTKQSLINNNAESIFLVDCLKQDTKHRVLFIEDCKSKRVWSNEEIITLLYVSRLIFSALDKDAILKQLKINSLNDKAPNIINKFYDENKQADKLTAINLIIDISKILNINKTTGFIYDYNTKKFFKSFDYVYNYDYKSPESNKGIIGNYSKELAEYYKQAINILSHDSYNKNALLNEYILDFVDLFNEENYFYTVDYASIKDVLEKVGFVSSRPDDVKEIYIFLTKHDTYFGYIIFEKYYHPKYLKAELEMLTSFCNILDSHIGKNYLLQKYKDELLMKDVILTNEKVPMAVVEKDTFKILYHNDLYYNIFPNIEIGGICYELLGNKQKCSECCIDKDVLMNDANHVDHQWIKKAIPFTLNNGLEAYMIYSKDSIDYIKQINAIDNLTQALLFRGFEEYYKNFIKNNDYNYVLCTLDIDKFKYINNIFGYQTGDKVLRKVAIVIRNFIGIDENFCRLGEDKFSIFLRYQDEVQLHVKIKELSKRFDKMKSENFTDIKITIIGGITVVDRDIALNTLLDQSSIARKSVKGSHKNNFSYYDPNIDVRIKKEILLEERIPIAIKNNEFVAYLQPKFDLRTKEICGAEALVRWITPDGMIFPDKFIPLFERNGFILTLDFIVYEKVMQHIRKCIDNNVTVYPISVNVSRNHINDKNFIDKFMKLVDKYKIEHKYLELEITESVFVEDAKKLKNFISGIKDYKLKVSIDDFGTAYSSLQNLTDISADILKIDKGFLDNIDMQEIITKNTSKDEILLKNIINLAKELDFHVICEGIETDDQILLLEKIGCEYGQGYIFAKPMPIEDYEKQFLNFTK